MYNVLVTVSPLWGFGLLDAGKLVEMARQWKPVGSQISCEIDFLANVQNRYHGFTQ